jgi:hypothetical protein
VPLGIKRLDRGPAIRRAARTGLVHELPVRQRLAVQEVEQSAAYGWLRLLNRTPSHSSVGFLPAALEVPIATRRHGIARQAADTDRLGAVHFL